MLATLPENPCWDLVIFRNPLIHSQRYALLIRVYLNQDDDISSPQPPWEWITRWVTGPLRTPVDQGQLLFSRVELTSLDLISTTMREARRPSVVPGGCCSGFIVVCLANSHLSGLFLGICVPADKGPEEKTLGRVQEGCGA